jgi:regulator of protease activity HflC (stomatin/prohibitin superfamily)
MDFLIPGLVVAFLYSFLSIRVLRQYERGVTFFLGKFWGTKGPGLIFLPAGFAN